MERKRRIGLYLSESVIAMLDRHAKRLGVPRSRLLEDWCWIAAAETFPQPVRKRPKAPLVG